MLDELGMSCKTRKSFMYVSIGCVVVMKGVKKNDLYIFFGKAVFDASNVSVRSNVDKTIMWHNRL